MSSAATANVEVLFNKLLSGDVKAQSQFKLRSESAREGNRMTPVKRLKRALDKNSKFLIPTEIAVPFNPENGQEDDTYNMENKWRPLFTATTACLILKMYASKNEDSKAEFMRRANVQDWDLSDLTTVTKADEQVFRIYRDTRIFTIPVFDVRDKLISGDYSKQFMVDIERDPVTNKIIGEQPKFLDIAKLWKDLKYEEWTNIKECIEQAKEGKAFELRSTNTRIKQIASLSLANITEKELEDVRKEVYGEIPVGSDRPANYVIMYELPLNSEMVLSDLTKWSANVTSQDMERCLVYTSLTKEIQTKVFDQFKTKWKSRDQYWDFYEVDMSCPATGTCADDPMLIGKDTRYELPINRISESIKDADDKVKPEESLTFFTNVHKLFTAALNDDQKLEQRFMQSTYIETYDKIIEDQLVDSLAHAKLFSHPFLTKKVATSNKKIITLAYGKKANQYYMELEAGISDSAEGALNEDDAEREANAANLTDLLVSGSAGEDKDQITDLTKTAVGTGNVIAADVVDFDTES